VAIDDYHFFQIIGRNSDLYAIFDYDFDTVYESMSTMEEEVLSLDIDESDYSEVILSVADSCELKNNLYSSEEKIVIVADGEKQGIFDTLQGDVLVLLDTFKDNIELVEIQQRFPQLFVQQFEKIYYEEGQEQKESVVFGDETRSEYIKQEMLDLDMFNIKKQRIKVKNFL